MCQEHIGYIALLTCGLQKPFVAIRMVVKTQLVASRASLQIGEHFKLTRRLKLYWVISNARQTKRRVFDLEL